MNECSKNALVEKRMFVHYPTRRFNLKMYHIIVIIFFNLINYF